MKVYLAFSRVRFEGDQLLGVFSSRENTEFAIGKYLKEIKERRQVDDDDELLFSLAADFCVDVYDTDEGINQLDSYSLSVKMLKDLLNQ